jgi:hypothetical protein
MERIMIQAKISFLPYTTLSNLSSLIGLIRVEQRYFYFICRLLTSDSVMSVYFDTVTDILRIFS